MMIMRLFCCIYAHLWKKNYVEKVTLRIPTQNKNQGENFHSSRFGPVETKIGHE